MCVRLFVVCACERVLEWLRVCVFVCLFVCVFVYFCVFVFLCLCVFVFVYL